MILREMYTVTERLFTDAQIEKIIEMGESKLETAKVASDDSKYKHHRSSNISWFPRNAQTEFIYAPVLNMVKMINVTNRWNFEYDVIEDLQYTTYNKDQFYNWHSDQKSIPYQDTDENLLGKIRKISFSVLLNDSFDGGNFEVESGLPYQTDRIKSLTVPTGSAIIFPSFLYHRVTEVTQGNRKSLVGWICGKPYR